MTSLNHNAYSDAAGTAALWTAFGASLFTSVVLLGITLMNDKPKNAVFCYLTTTMVAITALAYLVEALGNTEMVTDTKRPLLWIRYVQWATNSPMVVATLGLLAGCTVTELLFVTGLVIINVVAWFAAAISSGYNATWPIFVFGIVAALPVLGMVLGTWMGRASASGVPRATRTAFTTLAYLAAFCFIGYAINWGTAEGGKVETLDQEVIVYATLDILTKPVFSLILMFIPDAIDGAQGLLSYEPVATEAKAEHEPAVAA